ncbi:hypothetical protein OK016_11575 [Vibrio chagasii]|nr:hypothetical protein [Vibrio chagasii]
MLCFMAHHKTLSSYCERKTVSHAEAIFREGLHGDYVAIETASERNVKRGISGEAVALLDLLLSEVLGEVVSGSDVFDYELKMKVEAFQTWQACRSTVLLVNER